jgi:hypothetical protein
MSSVRTLLHVRAYIILMRETTVKYPPETERILIGGHVTNNDNQPFPNQILYYLNVNYVRYGHEQPDHLHCYG